MSLSMDWLEPLGLVGLAQNGNWPSAIINGVPTFSGGSMQILRSPIDVSPLGGFVPVDKSTTQHAIQQAHQAFLIWRSVPAPKRGELVRRIGEKVRKRKAELAQLITLEAGKIITEAEGEVQEWIDICDFAVGLSRQLHGLTIVSERSQHRMMEQWHPLGCVGVITAFNFPVAVWAWNAMLAFVCGDSVVWKPSEKTPICALAVQKLVSETIAEFGEAPVGLSQLVLGMAETGKQMAEHPLLPLISATGSAHMGKAVAASVGARLGRSLLELGGNNALIVSDSANLELALRAITFSAVGTCGQRCTTLRRLIVHRSIIDDVIARLVKAYSSLPIGDPRQAGVLVGPLIDEHAFKAMQAALTRVREAEETRIWGGERLTAKLPASAFYVRPAIARVPDNLPVVCQETFAPILYVMPYDTLDAAIALQNAVPQGLSSAIFTDRLQEAERFLSATGSDCGIANVNIGTSGAEIGGAFGGEKESGGGRESGSDAWKNYMRRATNTVNYGQTLPLAQGIQFDL